MDKKRLRRWLLLFFLALLLPAALLIQQSYNRLKWETFHQYQKMASELSKRIDNRLTRLIAAEGKRTFTDYTFSKATDDAKNTVILRSPLSSYPIDADIPGVLGYFQVDELGQLVTPLVPSENEAANGLTPEELNERTAIKNQMQEILAANQLVREVLPAQLENTAANASAGLSMQSSNSRDRAKFDGISLDRFASSLSSDVAMDNVQERVLLGKSAAEETVAALAPSVNNEFALEKDVEISSLDDADVMQESERVISPRQHEAKQPQNRKASPVQQTLAFDQLKERSAQVASKNNYAKVEDIPLKQNYQQQSEIKARKAKKKLEVEKIAITPTRINARIRTFESDIDPFEFSQLDSGHFVLFRKVWLNGQRYTQGLLIDQAKFLALIQNEFENTGLSEMSSVLVAYQGNVIRRFSQHNSARDKVSRQGLIGEELYQTRLSDPLSDLQMIYSVTDLPVGPGGRLILWLSLMMATVLLGGFYFMYRLGVRQINLANQQQDFVSAVSHELKTPLTSIRMYGEILKQGWASEEKKRHYYDFIYDESERLSRLINNVLQLARMNRNEQAPELVLCKVDELVQDIKAKTTSQLDAVGFKMVVDSEEKAKLQAISIDRDWLMQVMINLVDNAVKFSAKAERKEIILGVSQTNKKSVQFTVSDFGPGVDKESMKAIFELFYRSENELTRDTVGTGIGLSLVQQMVTSMGGKVSVRNREASTGSAESGALFSVSFPVVTDS